MCRVYYWTCSTPIQPEINSVWLEKYDVLRWIRAQTQPDDHPMTWSETSVTHKYVPADQWFGCMQQLATYITQRKRILLLWPVSSIWFIILPQPHMYVEGMIIFLFALYSVKTSKVFYIVYGHWNYAKRMDFPGLYSKDAGFLSVFFWQPRCCRAFCWWGLILKLWADLGSMIPAQG